jgi:hypothetical protein
MMMRSPLGSNVIVSMVGIVLETALSISHTSNMVYVLRYFRYGDGQKRKYVEQFGVWKMDA